MSTEREPPIRTESAWREAADLLRFVAEAAALSTGIVLVAWLLA